MIEISQEEWDAVQSQIASLSQRVATTRAGSVASVTETAPSSTVSAWRLYDLTPTVIDSGTTAGASWTASGSLSGVPSGATHVEVYVRAITGSSGDQVAVDYRSDSSDSTRPALETAQAQSAGDATDVCNTVRIPLAGGQFEYQVTGTFSSDTAWSLTLLGYYG